MLGLLLLQRGKEKSELTLGLLQMPAALPGVRMTMGISIDWGCCCFLRDQQCSEKPMNTIQCI